MFKKRNGELWIFISDVNGSKSQIDLILINENVKTPCVIAPACLNRFTELWNNNNNTTEYNNFLKAVTRNIFTVQSSQRS